MRSTAAPTTCTWSVCPGTYRQGRGPGTQRNLDGHHRRPRDALHRNPLPEPREEIRVHSGRRFVVPSPMRPPLVGWSSGQENREPAGTWRCLAVTMRTILRWVSTPTCPRRKRRGSSPFGATTLSALSEPQARPGVPSDAGGGSERCRFSPAPSSRQTRGSTRS